MCARYPDPSVVIGITLSTSPATLDPAAPSPFYLVVTGRIVKSPRPESPITLASQSNPFGRIDNRSFKAIRCVSSAEGIEKCINIWPNSWPNYNLGHIKDHRSIWDFVTIHPGEVIEVKHEVPREKIEEAGLKPGETYKAELTEYGLGTLWWMFGTLEDVEGRYLKRWGYSEEENDLSWPDEVEEERKERGYGPPTNFTGEDPHMLAIVIETGEVEFEIV